jgi:hypothetical protein
MARGWESKDVESQVEAKKTVSASPSRGPKTPEELSREQECRDLQLSRIRIVNDLQVATNPNHRKSLEAALAHLDSKIAKLS